MNRYKEAKKEDLEKQVKLALKEAKKNNKGLFIYGDTGTGKTHSLHAIANTKGRRVDNFVDLLSEFRDSVSKGYYHGKMIDITNVDILFIDDMGAEKMTEFVQEFVYSLLNRRYEKMKTTIIATNLTLEDFKERYGDRILSRVMEMCVLVEMSGEDRRIN